MVNTRRSRASDDAAAAAIKRQRAGHSTVSRSSSPAPSSGESAMQVFSVELLTQTILSNLDTSSVVHFATFLRSRDAWRHVLSDEKLWHELLVSHFGGPVPVPAPAATPAQLAAYRGDDFDFSDDDDDSAGDESGGDDSSDDDVDVATDQHIRATALPTGHQSSPPTTATTAATDAPTYELQLPVPRFACQSLVHFARSSRQRDRFRTATHVLLDDIGTIVNVDNVRIDGIAFASSGYLRNPGIGAANVVFERAGRGLDAFVLAADAHIRSGDVFVTPGFDAGVTKLIHCAGPIYSGGRGVPVLAQVYDRVVAAAVREQLACVAMTSISTGSLGFPLREAAVTALRALERAVRKAPEWTGTIAVVCYEPEVFDAFTQARQHVLDAFNAST